MEPVRGFTTELEQVAGVLRGWLAEPPSSALASLVVLCGRPPAGHAAFIAEALSRLGACGTVPPVWITCHAGLREAEIAAQWLEARQRCAGLPQPPDERRAAGGGPPGPLLLVLEDADELPWPPPQLGDLLLLDERPARVIALAAYAGRCDLPPGSFGETARCLVHLPASGVQAGELEKLQSALRIRRAPEGEAAAGGALAVAVLNWVNRLTAGSGAASLAALGPAAVEILDEAAGLDVPAAAVADAAQWERWRGGLAPAAACQLHAAAAAALDDMLVPGSPSEQALLEAALSQRLAAGQFAQAHVIACQLLQLGLQEAPDPQWQLLAETAAGYWERHCGGSGAVSPYLLRIAAHQQWYAGQRKPALKLAEEALALDAARADPLLGGRLQGDRGNLLAEEGRIDEAIAAYDSALDLLRQAGNPAALGVTLANIGILRHRQGRFRQARRLYEEAFVIASRNGNSRSMASILGYLATLHLDMERPELARPCYQQSLDLFDELGDQLGAAITLSDLGNCLSRLGEAAQAQACYAAAVEAGRKLNDSGLQAIAMCNQAYMHKEKGELAAARHTLAAALELLGAETQGYQAGFARAVLGDVLRLQRDPAAAEHELRLALRLLQESEAGLLEGLAWCYLALTLAGPDRAGAAESLAAAERLHLELGSPRDSLFYPALTAARIELQAAAGWN